MKGGKPLPRSVSSTWQLIAWAVEIVGTLLIALIVFLGIQNIRATYAFYNAARSTTQGTVLASDEEIYSCGDSCAGMICQTTVTFTPPGQSTPFTTADYQCNALDKGTQVEVLYDPHNPSIAKTPREASADITGAIFGVILGPIFALSIVLAIFAGVIVKMRGGYCCEFQPK